MKKQANRILRGDFFRAKGGATSLVALSAARSTSNPELCEVLVMNPGNGSVGYKSYGPGELVDIEVSQLSPAQAHAEELAARLNELAAYCMDESASYDAVRCSAKRARVLLDKVIPPSPVNEAELLAALANVPNAGQIMDDAAARMVAGLLDRAYRSGQLKAQNA